MIHFDGESSHRSPHPITLFWRDCQGRHHHATSCSFEAGAASRPPTSSCCICMQTCYEVPGRPAEEIECRHTRDRNPPSHGATSQRCNQCTVNPVHSTDIILFPVTRACWMPAFLVLSLRAPLCLEPPAFSPPCNLACQVPLLASPTHALSLLRHKQP